MVSVMLEAGCHKNAKMGIPGTITPLNLATELGLKDIVTCPCLASHGRKKSNPFNFISTHEIIEVRLIK